MEAFDLEIDWLSKSTEFIYSPFLSPQWQQRLEEVKSSLPALESHIWILSSGSTSLNRKKWIAISKKNFLNSAKSVNQHFSVTEKDIWLQVLPDFHVGGLSLSARAFLSKSQLIKNHEKWNASSVYKTIEQKNVSLCSLVPTQLYDLVQLNKRAPKNLRAVIVGGGRLNIHLLNRAQSLGYSVHPSFGMTETSSQVATSVSQILDDKIFYKKLAHASFKTNDDGQLQIQATSMMTGFADISLKNVEFKNQDPESWLTTSDLAEIQDEGLCILGRQDEIIKVSGELVSLPQLRDLLSEIVGMRGTVLGFSDDRTENALAVVLELDCFSQRDSILKDFSKKVMPYEKPQAIYFIEKIPRTELNKIKWAELSQILGK